MFCFCNSHRLLTNVHPSPRCCRLVFLPLSLETCLFLFVCCCCFFFFGGGGVGKISYSDKYWYVFLILELIVELSIQRPWDNELDDKKSEAFTLLSDLLENEVRLVYTENDMHASCYIFFCVITLVGFYLPDTLLRLIRTQRHIY